MKIGLVCPYNIYKGGGVQECVKALQSELTFRGHQAKIITPQPREVLEPLNDTILLGTAAQVRSPFHTTAQVSVNVKGDQVETMLQAEKFDVLHFHEPWVPILSRQILSRSTVPNVATFHAKLPDTIMSKTIERVITPYTKSVLRDLHCLTAVSEAASSYVRTLTEEQIHIIPNGVDLNMYAKKKTSSKQLNVLYVGRLEKRKGVKYLLKAFQLLQAQIPEVELRIAGDGPDNNKLQQQVDLQGLENVIFLGYVSEKDKLQLMREATVFCSPALYGESFGIVLLEAMALGVPVVAGDNPGYSSVMKESGRISLVNPRDAGSFSRTLHTMITDQNIRQLWQNWAENYVKQFSYKTVVDQYERLYKTVVKK